MNAPVPPTGAPGLRAPGTGRRRCALLWLLLAALLPAAAAGLHAVAGSGAP